MTHSGTCIDGPLNGKSYVCIHTSFGVLTNLDTVEPNENKSRPIQIGVNLEGTYTINPDGNLWNWSYATRQERQGFQKRGY